MATSHEQLFSLSKSKDVYQQLIKLYPNHGRLFSYFIALNEIPRGSGNTAAAQEWAMKIGEKLGCKVRRDETGNVVLYSPGTLKKPGIVLQGHVDMVITTAKDKVFDAKKDTVSMYVEKDLLRAHGTTLGADDGTGVAIALAILEDQSIKRGPLEVLLTFDEEVGLIGASSMAQNFLSPEAKYLINIDSEDFGEITTSCAGGVQRWMSFPMRMEPFSASSLEHWTVYKLNLSKFKGGHTGVQIHEGRANAVKWAMKVLADNHEVLTNGVPLKIFSINGGNAHNAVPSNVDVVFAVPKDKHKAVADAMRMVFYSLLQKFARIESNPPQMTLTEVDAKDVPNESFTYPSSKTALHIIDSVHHGVFKWSDEADNLVETSQSLSIIKTEGSNIRIQIFARSSVNEAMDAMSQQMEAFVKIYGGKMEKEGHDMKGWPAIADSHLLKKAKETFHQEFKKDAKIVPIHAGLECGVIMGKHPGNKMEALSVGPTVKNPHTIDEYCELKTWVDTYEYIKKLIMNL